MAHSYFRGHKIHCIRDIWFYSDTDELVSDNPNRQCGHCNKKNTKEGHDACLGTIPGLINACCGHGNIDKCYIQLKNGDFIRGENAKLIIDILILEK